MIDVIKIVASIIEILGIFLTANSYLRVEGYFNKLVVIVGSLFFSSFSKDAAEMAKLMPENKHDYIRGLSLIFVGFCLNFLVLLYEMILKNMA